jgi:hypothetical protein
MGQSNSHFLILLAGILISLSQFAVFFAPRGDASQTMLIILS